MVTIRLIDFAVFDTKAEVCELILAQFRNYENIRTLDIEIF